MPINCHIWQVLSLVWYKQNGPRAETVKSISENVNMPSLDDSGKEKLFPE